MSDNPCAKIFDHKWLDPECVETGCQSLRLVQTRDVLAKLIFAARTSGGTAGPDPFLMDACEQAEALFADRETRP